MSTSQDLYSAVQDAVVELFTLDATARGLGVTRFSAATNILGNAVIFNGNTFTPLPITGAGWARTTGDSAPRPTITISNVNAVIQSLIYSAGDLAGSTLTRQRVYSKYLDRVNFPRWNLFNYSEGFDNGAWGKTGGAVTANTTADPVFSNVAADTFVEDTSTGGHYLSETMSYTAGTQYTISAYVKAGSGTRFAQLVFTSNAFGATLVASFNLSTGATSTNSSNIVASSTSLGGGWYRVSGTATATATTAATTQLRLSNSQTAYAPSYTGDGTSSLIWWGAQLEASATASTYQLIVNNNWWFTSDPSAILSTDVYVVDRLVSLDKTAAQFELCWQLDRPGVRLPGRLALRDLGFPGLGLNAP